MLCTVITTVAVTRSPCKRGVATLGRSRKFRVLSHLHSGRDLLPRAVLHNPDPLHLCPHRLTKQNPIANFDGRFFDLNICSVIFVKKNKMKFKKTNANNVNRTTGCVGVHQEK